MLPVNLFRALTLLAVAMLAVGCDKKAEDLNPLKPSAKLPDTKGLPLTTNFYAQVDLKLEPQQKQAYATLFESLVKAAGSKAEGRTFLRKAEDAIGRLKDAGFGDFTKGDLNSIVFGMTLPETPAGFESFSPEDADITLILRGKFSPERTKAFCQAERVQESLVEGQTAWNLGNLVDKLTGEATFGGLPEDKSVWFAYADNGTLTIGTRSSLRKSLAALKGERASLKPATVKAAEDFKDWNFYLCFNNPRLIEAATAQARGNSSSDRIAARIIQIMPHDQALIITGARGDSEAAAVILSNEATQENIQYSVSASKSLTPKFLKIYTESISELIEEAGR
jgi:hypothetical protein